MFKLFSNSNEKSNLTPTIRLKYQDIKLIGETSYYQLYEAKNQATKQIHTIRALNISSAMYKNDKNKTTTLFFQEILRLCVQLDQSDAVIIDDFEVYDDSICFVTTKSSSLQYELSLIPNQMPQINIQKLLRDVESDVRFLYSKMRLRNIIIDPKTLFRINDAYFLSDWALATIPPLSANFPKVLEDTPIQTFAADETVSLVSLILELNGKKPQTLQEILKISDDDVYYSALESLVKSIEPDSVQQVICGMLKISSKERPALGSAKNVPVQLEKKEKEQVKMNIDTPLSTLSGTRRDLITYID